MQRSEVEALIRKHPRRYALKDEAGVAPLTGNRVVRTDATGALTASAVSSAELLDLRDALDITNSEDVSITGKLTINPSGANQATVSIGGGSASAANPVAIRSVASEWLKGETDHIYATTQQLNTHACRSRVVLHSNSNEHPNVSFDCNSANASGQPRVANSFYRFRFNYSGRFEIWPSTTGVKAHAYGSLSDGRMKWNNRRITADDGLAVVRQLNPFLYDKSADITDHQPAETTRESGYIAQEVHQLLPHVAGPGPAPEDPWTIRHSALLPYHTAAISALEARIAALETRL